MDSVVWDAARGEFVDPNAKGSLSARPTWVPDAEALECKACLSAFSMWLRRHHCRACGCIFCFNCSNYYIDLPPEFEYVGKQRVCLHCYSSLSERSKTEGTAPSKDFDEEILTAQFYIRSHPGLSFNKALEGIGWRRPNVKAYAMLDVEENGSKYQALISIVNGARAPVSLSSDVGSRFFKWILTNLQHPLIMPVSRCEYMIEQGKAVTVRRYESKGSLRDQVYRSTPRYTYDYKYKSGGRALGAKEIALYGRQVLEALSYLEHIGFPYPHLHSGNVILNDKKVCMLSEVENTLLGVAPFYFLESNAKPEVECFGHLLYELALGVSKPTSRTGGIAPIPATCPKPFYEVLKCIFEPAPDASPPTISDLLKFPVFSQVDFTLPEVQPLKLKKRAREFLQEVAATIPTMLQDIRTPPQAPAEDNEEDDGSGAKSPIVSPRASASSAQRKSSAAVQRTVSPRRTVVKANTVASVTRPSSTATASVNTAGASALAGAPSVSATTSPSSGSSTRSTVTPASPPISPRAPSTKSHSSTQLPPVSTAPISGGGPPPPPPPPAPPVPPPPPPANVQLPQPQQGRNALLESIRMGKALKKVDKHKQPSPAASKSKSGGGGGGGGKAPAPAPMNIGDALKARFANIRTDDSSSDDE